MDDAWVMTDDRLIQQTVEAAVAPIRAPSLHVRVSQGVVHLSGTVASDAERRHAEQVAAQVEGVKRVENALVVNLVAGSRLGETGTAYQLAQEGAEDEIPGAEVSFNRSIGTTDEQVAEKEGDEPYFPPTDPVIEPLSGRQGGYRVLGGYAESAMDSPLAAEPAPERLERGDEQIAENVRLALREDALTTDLALHVHVRHGVVYLHGKVRYLQDVEAAEEVSGRVAGVREVREQLQME